MLPQVIIIGRPNVGKSTLFNRLVGKRLALVDDQPGVTRDRRFGEAHLLGLDFTVVDTAGWEDDDPASLPGRMRAQTEASLQGATVALFVVDARAGITPLDEEIGRWLRSSPVPVVLVANKAEGRAAESGLLEAYALGLGEPVALSAEHGEGMGDLFEALLPHLDDKQRVEAEDEAEDELSGPLKLAIVGRPNAGKSTLINRMLGEDRLLTGPEAGITRDAISVRTDFMGTPMRIFDTAGMRKRGRVTDKLEKLSVADGLRAVRFAEVVVVLLDVAIPFEQQDLRIADLAETEGRAVVLAANKWDLEEDKADKLKELRESFERLLPQLKGAPLVTVSAKTGKGLDRLHNAIMQAYKVWNARVSTSKLNRWLEAMTEAHPPPAPGGRRIRLRYMTQVKTRPPAFVVKATHTDKIPESYHRYLINGLRQDFDMPGTPIRIFFRDQGTANPYRAKANKISQSGALSKHKNRQKPKGT